MAMCVSLCACGKDYFHDRERFSCCVHNFMLKDRLDLLSENSRRHDKKAYGENGFADKFMRSAHDGRLPSENKEVTAFAIIALILLMIIAIFAFCASAVFS
jgi:hypothetical protein